MKNSKEIIEVSETLKMTTIDRIRSILRLIGENIEVPEDRSARLPNDYGYISRLYMKDGNVMIECSTGIYMLLCSESLPVAIIALSIAESMIAPTLSNGIDYKKERDSLAGAAAREIRGYLERGFVADWSERRHRIYPYRSISLPVPPNNSMEVTAIYISDVDTILPDSFMVQYEMVHDFPNRSLERIRSDKMSLDHLIQIVAWFREQIAAGNLTN